MWQRLKSLVVRVLGAARREELTALLRVVNAQEKRHAALEREVALINSAMHEGIRSLNEATPRLVQDLNDRQVNPLWGRLQNLESQVRQLAAGHRDPQENPRLGQLTTISATLRNGQEALGRVYNELQQKVKQLEASQNDLARALESLSPQRGRPADFGHPQANDALQSLRLDEGVALLRKCVEDGVPVALDSEEAEALLAALSSSSEPPANPQAPTPGTTI